MLFNLTGSLLAVTRLTTLLAAGVASRVASRVSAPANQRSFTQHRYYLRSFSGWRLSERLHAVIIDIRVISDFRQRSTAKPVLPDLAKHGVIAVIAVKWIPGQHQLVAAR
jgi:hypothetical protein